ncbi:hypothetical protein BP5796_10591 [Coleophoma crateriformis]|uniref:Uncharacterized protein n=1 Tax=Coleophoma crateriformis TaxID=565419 RepID=A0A3D8QQK2_9HELO|nr:hypothetical protein BP5796_10591 [Coleophoma crateriformis]
MASGGWQVKPSQVKSSQVISIQVKSRPVQSRDSPVEQVQPSMSLSDTLSYSLVLASPTTKTTTTPVLATVTMPRPLPPASLSPMAVEQNAFRPSSFQHEAKEDPPSRQCKRSEVCIPALCISCSSYPTAKQKKGANILNGESTEAQQQRVHAQAGQLGAFSAAALLAHRPRHWWSELAMETYDI